MDNKVDERDPASRLFLVGHFKGIVYFHKNSALLVELEIRINLLVINIASKSYTLPRSEWMTV